MRYAAADQRETQDYDDDLATEDDGTYPKTKGPLTLHRYENWLWEINNQPFWRTEADIEADYYDNNQLTASELQDLHDRGLAPLVTNLIAPTVDTVLGMEAKSRTEWKVAPDEDDNDDMAEALNVKLHEAERIAKVDRAVSDAYAGQIKVGLHWAEVSREFDPFAPPYRVKAVHRREIWWDWLAREPDLSDARYLVRRRWTDEDLAILMFPDHADLISNALSGWNDWNYELDENATGNTWLIREWGIEQNSSIEEQEWLDTDRRRVCIHECWYRDWVRGKILRLPNGMVVEYNPKNPLHAEAVVSGLIKPQSAILSKVRLAWFIGPHKLVDMDSPYPHNKFPYVPFFGKREDRTGVPYGLIRSMKSPQDEVNARKRKMMWLLSARRVIADEDAVANHEVAAAEVARPDSYIKLKKDRRRENAFKVDDNVDLSVQQFHVMQEAKQEVQDAAGVYNQMMGKDMPGGATSGIAINSLVEQGSITLAEMNDNYRYSRMLVGELLLSLVKEDIGDQETAVLIAKGTDKERTVVLNQAFNHPQIGPMRNNDIARTKMSVVLEDVPNTPTYKAQQLNQLSELTKALPPEMQAAIVDMVVEATDLKQRHDIADRLRKVNGMGKQADEMTDEEKAIAQQQQQFQQQMQDLQMREQQAKTAKAEAEAKFTGARTEKTLAETAKIDQTTDHDIDSHALSVAEGAKRLTEHRQEERAEGE